VNQAKVRHRRVIGFQLENIGVAGGVQGCEYTPRRSVGLNKGFIGGDNHIQAVTLVQTGQGNRMGIGFVIDTPFQLDLETLGGGTVNRSSHPHGHRVSIRVLPFCKLNHLTGKDGRDISGLQALQHQGPLIQPGCSFRKIARDN